MNPTLQNKIKQQLGMLVYKHANKLANQRPFNDIQPIPNKDFSLFAVRHGSTEFTEKGLMHGFIDIPISEDGKLEVSQLTEKLKEKKAEKIYTSELKRASQTAKIIARKLGLPIQVTPALNPWDIGDLAGTNRDKAMKEIMDLAQNNPDQPASNGESFNNWKNRVLGGLLQLLRQEPNQRIILVTHSICNYLIKAWIKKGAKPTLDFDMKTFIDEEKNTGEVDTLKLNLVY